MKTFDLESAVAEWRKSLMTSDGISADAAEELEGHLTQSIAELEQVGLTQEESFLIAARRLGHVDTLSCEFSQVSASTVWKRRIFWALIGFVDLSLILIAISTIGRLGLWGASALEAPGGLVVWTVLSYGLGALLVGGVIGLIWKFVLNRSSPSDVVEMFGRYPVFCSVSVLVTVVAVSIVNELAHVLPLQLNSQSLEMFGQQAVHAQFAFTSTLAILFVAICVALGILSKSFNTEQA